MQVRKKIAKDKKGHCFLAILQKIKKDQDDQVQLKQELQQEKLSEQVNHDDELDMQYFQKLLVKKERSKNGNVFQITNVEKLAELDECIICRENYKLYQMYRELPCGHSFHKRCLDRWTEKRSVCPLCKIAL